MYLYVDEIWTAFYGTPYHIRESLSTTVLLKGSVSKPIFISDGARVLDVHITRYVVGHVRAAVWERSLDAEVSDGVWKLMFVVGGGRYARSVHRYVPLALTLARPRRDASFLRSMKAWLSPFNMPF